MKFKEIKQNVDIAICKLEENDKDLLDLNVNERSITHKLAVYLQEGFKQYEVDVEYNRKGNDKLPKLMGITPGCVNSDSIEGGTIYPDIIVHERKKKKNKLVVEIKKSNNTQRAEINHDIKKIKFLIKDKDYKYDYGLLLVLDVESKLKNQHQQYWYYARGPHREIQSSKYLNMALDISQRD